MSQREQILEILKDGEPHRSDEFLARMFGDFKYGLFRLGARIHEIRKDGYEIDGWRDKEHPSLYWYKLQSFPSVENPPKEVATNLVKEERTSVHPVDLRHAAQTELFPSQKTHWDHEKKFA